MKTPPYPDNSKTLRTIGIALLLVILVAAICIPLYSQPALTTSFALIASALLLSMYHLKTANNYQAIPHATKQRKLKPLKHWNENDGSLADLMERAFHYGQALNSVAEQSERRVNELELSLRNVAEAKQASVQPFLADSKRISSGIRERVTELQRLCRNPSSPEFLTIQNLLQQKVIVDDFGRELLRDQRGTSWSRSPEAWKEILDVLIRRAEFRCQQISN